MSRTIDERVVEMKFDNKQFETNVRTSMSTLEKLKDSLNMRGAAKSFEELDKASKKVDMSGLGSAVESVRLQFSTLQVVAITTLQNITNSAINAGERLVRALSIDQVFAGWDKLIKKTSSVQTLVNSTGKTVDEINSYLEKLMWYSDETSYGFTDMTSALATMVSSGGDINKLIPMIEGVANATAFAGKGASEFSRIMQYAVNQAYSLGYMQVADWKTIEGATVNSKQLIQSLITAGEELGKIKKGSVTIENFRSTLADKWVDKEVMESGFGAFSKVTEEIYKGIQDGTFKNYADGLAKIGDKFGEFAYRAAASSQEAKSFAEAIDATKDAVSSGWMKTFELIFGNYEEQRVLWTDLSNALWDVFASGAESRNALLEEWADLGGRTTLIEAFWEAWNNVAEVLGVVKEAFREVFPPITAKKLYSITEGLKSLAEHLKISEAASENLKSTFKGLFAVLDIIKKTLSAVFTAIKPLFTGFGKLSESILRLTGGLGKAIVAFDEFLKSSNLFQKVGKGVAAVFQMIMAVLSVFFNLFSSLIERAYKRIDQVGDAAREMKSGVIAAFDDISETIANCHFVQLLSTVWNAVKTIGNGIVKILGELGSSLVKNLSEANFSGVIDLLNGISFGAIAVGITKFVGTFKKVIEDIGSFKKSFIEILDSVRGCFEAYQNRLQAGTLLKIASAIAILTASLIALSLVDSKKLDVALGSITVLFAELLTSMAIFNKISGRITGVMKSITAMLGIATAVLILASALKKIADLDAKHLITGLIGIAGLTAMMIAAAKAMSSNSEAIIKGATQMAIFAAAIKILASVCEQLAKLNWNQLAKGLIGVGILLTEVSLFLSTAKFSSKSITTAAGIVILSAAIKVLASACKVLGEMKWEEIDKGLSSIAVLLAEIAIFTKLTENTKHVISTGIALIAIAAAMKILASAVKDFSTMQWDEIARGLTAMAGALTAITIAVKFMPNNMTGIGTGLVIVAAALVVLSTALEKMGNLSWEQVAKGLITLGGAMTILAIGLNAMTGTLAGSAALLVAASALLVLTPVLTILGAMSWSSIVKGLVALAGAFVILGVAGAVLTPLVPSILALSGSLALIGIAVAGIGAGLTLAGAGLSALAVGLTALATAIIASLTIIVTGAASLIPAILTKVGDAIVGFCKVIVDSADAIGEAVKTIVLMLINVLVECIPAIADGVLKLIAGVLEALAKYTPSVVDFVFKFLIAILDGIAKNLPSLIQSAVNVLMAFFSGIVTALKSIDTKTLLRGIIGIGLLAAIMVALNAVAALVPGAMLGILGMGAVIAELALVIAAIGVLAQLPGLNWLINEGGNLLRGIGTAIGDFIGGIVGGFMNGVSSQFPKIGSDLSNFMINLKPFIDGAKSITREMLDGVNALAQTILILTAANVVDGLSRWFTGGRSLSSFADEVKPLGTALKDFAGEVKGLNVDDVAKAAEAGLHLAEMISLLPTKGGLNKLFTGSVDIDKFKTQMEAFAEGITAFSGKVDGLKTDDISKATDAGKAIAEMMRAFPTTGSTIEKFFKGETDMSVFGTQLVSFGESMNEYSEKVTGLNPDVVENSRNIANTLIELAKSVPTSGAALKNLFTGENNIAKFGEQLSDFGKSFVEFYNSVGEIEASKLTGIVTEIGRLVDIAATIGDSEKGAMSGFAKGLKDLGKAGIDGLVNSFNDAGVRISAVIDLLIGIIGSKNEKFVSAGKTMMTKLASGIKSGGPQCRSSAALILSDCLTAINGKASEFYSAGLNAAAEFANGITANAYLAVARASEMAAAAAAAAGSGIDIQPTIRPVLDLSNVSSGVGKLTALMSKTQAMKISAGMNRESSGANQNGNEKSSIANNYNFTQNNYSPKSLSRIDIYRQTKNQFAALKGLVET
jgi:putative tape measure domain protein|nr:MAG TPA: tail tape measure [Caudoviricetes sp.]